MQVSKMRSMLTQKNSNIARMLQWYALTTSVACDQFSNDLPIWQGKGGGKEIESFNYLKKKKS